jgi:hypothetical protein
MSVLIATHHLKICLSLAISAQYLLALRRYAHLCCAKRKVHRENEESDQSEMPVLLAMNDPKWTLRPQEQHEPNLRNGEDETLNRYEM